MDIDSPPYTRCFQGLLFQTPFPSFSQRGRKLKVLSSRSDSVGVVSIERDVLSIRALFFIWCGSRTVAHTRMRRAE